MDRFVSRHNIENLKRQLEVPADESQRATLVRLLAEEEAKAKDAAALRAKG